jgi:hypothetical protein
VTEDNQNTEQQPDEKLTQEQQDRIVSGVVHAGKVGRIRAERADNEQRLEDDKIADAAVDAAQEQPYPDPSNPEFPARIEREGAEQGAGEDVIAPYEAVPGQYAELAAGYHQMATELSRDANIPAGEAEIMLHLAIGGAAEAVGRDLGAALSPGQVPGVDLSNRQQCLTYLDRKYGTTEAKIIVERAVAEFNRLPQKWRERLDHNDGTNQLLTNSPHLLLALAMRNLGWTRQSKEAAQAELAKMAGKKLSAFDLEKRRVLSHIVSRGQSADNKKLTAALAERKAKPLPPSAEQKVRADLADLRRNKAYFDRNHPSHREVVAQVVALTAKLHPEGGR